MNILITAGGTKEYIDGVRYIGNSSTGRTGAQMVNYLSQMNHQVTWLGAKDAIKPSANCQQVIYETFDELQTQLEKVLSEQEFDVVFHAAAVSDFKVTSVILNNTTVPAGRDCKIPTADHARLNLERNPKLIDSLKSWSKNSNLLVVGFKLTNSSSQKAINKAIDKMLGKHSGGQNVVDYVAHNNLPDITEDNHRLNLYHHSGTMYHCESPEQLCDKVVFLLEQAA